ncbi:MAG: hypothetical protein IRY94_12450, partial [Rhodospirillaceae bacterium]|nr:hypothetical protein [Rhodospirillaceae bacterium]
MKTGNVVSGASFFLALAIVVAAGAYLHRMASENAATPPAAIESAPVAATEAPTEEAAPAAAAEQAGALAPPAAT